MIRFLPVVIHVVMVVYCLIDLLQHDGDEVRGVPKWGWVMLLLLFPFVGWIAYLAVRPRRRTVRPTVAPRPLAPDDDPAFLASLRDLNASHARTLDQWEADLRRREEELRAREADLDAPGPTTPDPADDADADDPPGR